jgi:hypothetical protein
MAKKPQQQSFNDVLATLGTQRFDVAPAHEGAKRSSQNAAKAFRVSKYGCAAEIAPAPDGRVEILARPGWLLNGEISRLLDRGYQKFFKTPKLEIPATADHLRAIHEFSEELKEAAGALSLYNESLGTTSDVYMYDRVKGRPTD